MYFYLANNGGLGLRDYKVTPAADGTAAQCSLTQITDQNNGTGSGFAKNAWIHFDMYVQSSGAVVATVTRTDVAKYTFNSVYGVPSGSLDKAYLGFTEGDTYATYNVDNIKLCFSDYAIVNDFASKYSTIIGYGKDISTYPTDENLVAAIKPAIASFKLDYLSLYSGLLTNTNISDAKTAIDNLEDYIQQTEYQAIIDQFKTDYSDVLGYAADTSTLPTDPTQLATVKNRTDAAITAFNGLDAQVRAMDSAAEVLQKLSYLNKWLNYSNMAEAGIYTQDFEGTSDFVPYVSYTDENGNPLTESAYGVTDTYTKNGVLSGAASDNTVFNVATSMTMDHTAFHKTATYKRGEFLTADIFNVMKSKGKYVKAASCDMYLNNGIFTEQEICYSFADQYNYKFFGINCNYNYSNFISERDYNVSGNSNNYGTATFNKGNGRIYSSEVSGKWYHVKMYYDAAGYANLIFTNADNEIVTFRSSDAISLNQRFFSVGVMGGGSYFVDNVKMEFTANGDNSDIDAAYGFINNSDSNDVFEMDASSIAPFDVAKVNSVASAFGALSTNAKARLTDKNALVSAVATQAAKWDLTSDASIAQSFKTIFGSALSTVDGAASAHNVYNRLTAQQKALLSSKYASMIATLASAPADTTKAISCVGDSITYGSYSSNDTTKSYPAQLQTLLGGGYTGGKYAIPGERVLNATNLASDSSTALQFKNTREWYQSHSQNADMVILMMGTNDAPNLKACSTDSAKAQFKAAYTALVQSYLALPSSPTVIIATMPLNLNGEW